MAIPDRREHTDRQNQYQAGCIGRAPRQNEDRRRTQGIKRVICNPTRQPDRRAIADADPVRFHASFSCRSGLDAGGGIEIHLPALNVSNSEQIPNPFPPRLASFVLCPKMEVLLRKSESVAGGDLNVEPKMEKFIHDENIRLYRRLLADATDPTDAERRRVLLKLLAEEEAKDQRPPERKQA